LQLAIFIVILIFALVAATAWFDRDRD